MADRLRIRVHFKDEREPVVVTLGGFAQIATKRRFGLPALKTDDPEVLMFGVFVELVGPAGAAKSDDPDAVDPFDAWLVDVDYWEAVRKDGTPDEADDEDPQEAVIPSDSSPESPPTSD